MVHASSPLAVQRQKDQVHQVIDKDEIAPRIHHVARLAAGEPLVERREWAADIPGAIRVGQPEGNSIQSAEQDIGLASRLADGVTATFRADRMSKRDRLLNRLQSVAQRRLEVDDSL